jgi:transcriptional regulator with XRE-family HTH domain
MAGTARQRTGTPRDPIIGLRVAFFRKKAHLAQETLAQQAGVSIGVISRLERGSQSVSVERLRDIAIQLGVTLNDLAGMTPKEGGNADLERAILDARVAVEKGEA